MNIDITGCNDRINLINFTFENSGSILRARSKNRPFAAGRCERMIGWTIVGLVALYGITSLAECKNK